MLFCLDSVHRSGRSDRNATQSTMMCPARQLTTTRLDYTALLNARQNLVCSRYGVLHSVGASAGMARRERTYLMNRTEPYLLLS